MNPFKSLENLFLEKPYQGTGSFAFQHKTLNFDQMKNKFKNKIGKQKKITENNRVSYGQDAVIEKQQKRCSTDLFIQ